MKVVTALVLAMIAGGASAQTPAPISEFLPGGPSPEVVARVEARVSMPQGARPIGDYLRIYFPYEGKVVGYYRGSERADPADPRSAPVVGIRSGPVQTGYVSDGGCDFITVVYDPATDTVERADCNGYA